MHVNSLSLLSLLASLLMSSLSSHAELPENFIELSDDVQAVLLEVEFFSEQGFSHWGDDFVAPSSQSYVKYLDDYDSRAQIDFNLGKIRVETLKQKAHLDVLKHAIVSTLLTPADPQQVDIYTAQEVGLSGEPFLLNKVKDHEGKTIAFSWRAQRYAQYLLDHKLQSQWLNGKRRYWVDIPLVRQFKQIAAQQYLPYVTQAALRYRMDEALILALIEAESSFNPFAVSHAQAYGLMQIMPNTAGRDYFQRIKNNDHRPSRQFLFNAKNNIEVGSGYLSILRDVYLRGIQNPLAQEYCMIAAYNGGAGQLLRSFDRNNKKAIAKINRLSAAQVYQFIISKHPKLESRNYLKKVMRFKKKYSL
ncbi:MAG: membrane-bound lytic murein transglycosylase C [Oleispira sp.]|jgi:membrane-bound lytic murein transglycosylase C